MNILTAQQVREWDAYTILHEPISSRELMERAADKCIDWIHSQSLKNKTFRVFCGKGNNGGDGLAIARKLFLQGYTVSVYILEFGKPGTDDFQKNLRQLHDFSFTEIFYLQSTGHFPVIEPDEVIIEALFGSGLNKPPGGLAGELIDHINRSGAKIISIDVPGGLFMDSTSLNNKVVHANHTLTFQCYKTGLLVQENAEFVGAVHVMDIGLHPGYLQNIISTKHFLRHGFIQSLFKSRDRFAHKGNFGHALLIAGSYGKIGAAILTTRACIHSGAGLVTSFIPRCGYLAMQVSVPEAMVIADEQQDHISQLPTELKMYNAIGIGPGIGTQEKTIGAVSELLKNYNRPVVMDADGLNCISIKKKLLQKLPPGSILTPHLKEFDRLFGEHISDFDRIKTAVEKASELNAVIILKGHHTMIATPDAQLYFNSTGNAGMATAGSGDVLTGMLTSFLAQHYQPSHAAILGVYMHGLAGDFAADSLSKEAMSAGDIIQHLASAFKIAHRRLSD